VVNPTRSTTVSPTECEPITTKERRVEGSL